MHSIISKLKLIYEFKRNTYQLLTLKLSRLMIVSCDSTCL